MTFDGDFLYILLLCGLSVMIGVLSMLAIARNCGIWINFGRWSESYTSTFVFRRCYKIKVFRWHPFVLVGFRYWVRASEYRTTLAGEVRHLQVRQSSPGQWDHSPYQLGLYNGIEVTLALLENRDPDFRDPPAAWACEALCSVCGQRDIHTGLCGADPADMKAKCNQFAQRLHHLHNITDPHTDNEN
jgi:hypothetical protein